MSLSPSTLSEKVVSSRIFFLYTRWSFPRRGGCFWTRSSQPQIEGLTTMELMVQVRHTGRMLSNFRIGLGGEARLKVDVDLGAMIPREALHGWRFRT